MNIRPMNIIATCDCCGKETVFELTTEETKTYLQYLILGNQLGAVQDLFPRVPAWIRSGAIEDNYCLCPDCTADGITEENGEEAYL